MARARHDGAMLSTPAFSPSSPAAAARLAPGAAGRAMLWAALLTGLAMDIVVKLLGDSVGTAATVAGRWTFGLLFLLPLVAWLAWRRRWPAGDASPWRRIHAGRALLNLGVAYGLVVGLQALPLALVMTIFFAEPLLMVMLAALLGRQRLARGPAVVCALGLLGVVVATWGDWLRLGAAGPDLWIAALVALGGALCGALQTVVTQVHGRGVSSASLVFWTTAATALATLAALGMAGPSAWSLGARELAWLALVGALGTAFSLLWVAALKRVPARVAAHVLYLTLPLGALAGWLGFGEVPHAVSVVGSLVVFVAVAALEAWPRGRSAQAGTA